jgi:3-hydroxyacyl-CoA dehydrogenase
VQVIKTPETSQETFQALLNFGKAVGKATVEAKVCNYLMA